MLPLSRPSPEQLFASFQQDAFGDECSFEVSRPDRAGLFFSQDAMEFLHDQMWMFAGARLMRYNTDNDGKPPKKMTVHVKVEFE